MSIKIIAQYLKDLSFQIPHEPQIFLNPQSKPDIAVSIDIDAKKISAENFEIILKISADAKSQNQQLFTCQVSYAGLVALNGIEGEMLEQVLLIYCPNLLFPFLRRIIANLTIDAGFAPLMLDTIDFAELFARRKATEKSTPISDLKN
jgi:preprotein translocase subunit SecB